MAHLPKGWGQEVADAEETINRQNIRHGEYLLLHKQPVYKETKAGNAMIIEHRIIEAKPNPLFPNVEPMAKDTDWGYFMPDYGDAKVMLKPNLKAYVMGLLGLDKAKFVTPEAKRQLGDTIDAMCDERYLARGMLVRGVTFETDTDAGRKYIGMNWYPIVGENNFNAESVKKRRGELDAAAAAAPSTPPPGASTPPPPGSPPPPTSTQMPPPPSAPDPIQAYLAKGWKEHPQAKDFLFIGEGTSYQAKSKADIIAGR